MVIKKYPQSHLLITNDQNKKLIIDPGYLTFQKGFKVSDFQGADVYLITHTHADHMDPETIKEVVGEGAVFGNFDVVNKLKSVGVIQAKEVKNRQKFAEAGFEIEAVDLPHFRLPEGYEPPPNTGFLIDGIFFHGGDGFKIEQNLLVDNAALAFGHPSLSTFGVLEFAKSLGAKTLVPIHYDAWPRDPSELFKVAQKMGYQIKIQILSPGEETTI